MNRYSGIVGFGVLVVVFGVLGAFVLGGPTKTISPQPSASPFAAIAPNCAEWMSTHLIQPNSKFGLAISVSVINAELKVGETLEVMKVTSIGSKGFQFCVYPRQPGADGFYWNAWSGGMKTDSMTEVKITGLKVGIYSGKVTLIDLDTGRSVDIPVNVIVR